jgi:hypothetical protein
VCEPQSVRTDVRYFGLYGFRTSKTFRPSHVDGSLGVVVDALWHVSSVRRESVDVTRHGDRVRSVHVAVVLHRGPGKEIAREAADERIRRRIHLIHHLIHCIKHCLCIWLRPVIAVTPIGGPVCFSG